MFEKVGTTQAKVVWGRVNINYSGVKTNSLYLFVPQEKQYVKCIIVSVLGNKYAFGGVSEGTANGAIFETNYTFTNDTIGISPNIGENVNGQTIDMDVYRMSYE